MGKGHDEVVNVGGLGCGPNVFACCLRVTQRNVVKQGSLDQLHVLQHHSHFAVQRIFWDVAQVHAVENDGTIVGVPQARQQACKGGFPGPGRPH